MSFQSIRKTFLSALLATSTMAVFTACSPTPQNSTAPIRISLPDTSSLAKDDIIRPAQEKPSLLSSLAARVFSCSPDYVEYKTIPYISRVMINATGAGLNVPPYIEDRGDRFEDISKPWPEVISVGDVPKQSKPNVQVLIIMVNFQVKIACDANTGNLLTTPIKKESFETFYYGRSQPDMATLAGALDVTVSQIKLGTGNGQGVVTGRYLAADGSGPTGRVNIKLQIDPTLEPMTVSTSEIHGGWFTLFGMEGWGFRYFSEDGTEFLSGLKLGDLNSVGATTSRLLARMPGYYRSVWNGQTVVGRKLQDPLVVMAGFFGPGSTGKKICYESASGGTFSGAYVSSDLNNNDAITWAGAGAVSDPTRQARVSSGGIASPAGVCDGDTLGTDLYSSWLKLDYQFLQNQNESLKFRGPFKLFIPDGSNSTYPTGLDAKMSNGTLNLEWRFMPGVLGAGKINGVKVFMRQLATAPISGDQRPPYERDDGIACNRLTDPNFLTAEQGGPFSLIKDVAATAAAAQTTSLSGVSASDFAAGKIQIILCPYSNSRDKLFTSGVDFRGTGGGDGSGGGGSNESLQVSIALNSPKNTCVPATISHYANGTLVPVNTATSVNVSTASGAGGSSMIYSDSACATTGQYSASASIAAGASDVTVYVKSSLAEVGWINVSGTNMFGKGQPYVMLDSITPTGTGLQIYATNSAGTAHLISNYCYQMSATIYNSGSGAPANNNTVNMTLNAASGSFFSDPSCATVLGSLNYAANEAFKLFYFKPGAAGGSISTSGGPAGSTAFDVSPSVVESWLILRQPSGPGTPSQYFLSASECFPISVIATASNAAWVNVTSNTQVNLSSNDFMLSMSNTCANAQAALTVTVGANSSTGMLYAKPNAGKSSGFIAATSASPAASGTGSFDLAPDSISLLSFSTYPTPGSVWTDFCHKFRLELKRGGAFYSPAIYPMARFSGSSNAVLYTTESDCQGNMGGAGVSSFTHAMMTPTGFDFWARFTTTNPNPTIKVSLDNYQAMSATFVATSSTYIPSLVMPTFTPAVNTWTGGECVQITPAYQSGMLLPEASGIAVTLSSSANTVSNQLYVDATCATPFSSPAMVSAGGAMPSVYMKLSPTFSGANVSSTINIWTTQGFAQPGIAPGFTCNAGNTPKCTSP